MAQIAVNNRIRVIVDTKRYPIYKKAPYVIPITGDNTGFRTGQELTVRQTVTRRVKGEDIPPPDAIPQELKDKYKFIIDPTDIHKVRHLEYLDKKTPRGSAMLKLLQLSGEWANSKTEFESNPVKFKGWLEDINSESAAKNNKARERYEAETCIYTASINDYKRIALILSYSAPHIDINTHSSEEIMKAKLIEACESNPKEVKMCFVKYNPGIDRDIFILECIDSKIILKKDKGDLWLENEYLGTNLEDVKMFFGKKGNEYIYSKLQSLLDRSKGNSLTDLSINGLNKKKSYIEIIMECKAAIFDGDLNAAKMALSKLDKEEFPIEYDSLKIKIEGIGKVQQESLKKTEREKFVELHESMDLEKIQSKIEHKNSQYSPEVCKGFWNDKEMLIKYMTEFKFGAE